MTCGFFYAALCLMYESVQMDCALKDALEFVFRSVACCQNETCSYRYNMLFFISSSLLLSQAN